ncbi:MAG: hypothetical protein AMJ69_09895 [Gammaproteobacteria bacterium SG8_47]|nr:MAG: hypothetical protein AMJ69_09895 [Gammaproteobacteria bacterium SG8_47]
MNAVVMPEYPASVSERDMRVSEAAQQQFAQLMSGADADILGIRVFVTGGGCGGMTYGMTYADQSTAQDSVLEGEGFKLYVDPVALNYLSGCEIDYVRSGVNETFVFNNVFQSVGGSGVCGGCGGGGCGGGY